MAFLCATQTAMADVVTDPYTWVAGQPITAATQNTRFSTLYNGFTTISNVNIKTGAAIAPTKLDTTLEYPILRAALANCFTAGTTGDTVPRVALTSDGFIKFGAGSASALDVMLKRSNSTTLSIRNAADNADRHLAVGDITATGTFTGVNLTSTGTFTGVTVALTGVLSALMATGNNTIYTGITGDANPRVALTSDGGIKFGAGGASAVDMLLKREDANTLAVRNAGDSSYKNLKCDVITPATPMALSTGGTGANLTAAQGGLVYSGAAGMAIQSAGVAGQIPLSGGTGAPTWIDMSAIMGGRLSLTSNTPVTSSDVTGATAVKYTPYTSNLVSLYDGSTGFALKTYSEISINVPATTNTMYDVFLFDSSGVTGEAVAWTNDTTRATALTTVNGICCFKTGATERRYVGSFRTTGVSGQTEDSAARRLVWNMHNRVSRRLYGTDATNTWSYTTGTWRASNNTSTPGTGNRVDFIIGHAGSAVNASFVSGMFGNGAATTIWSGLAMDSTTTPDIGQAVTLGGASYQISATNSNVYTPAVGYHFISGLEKGAANGGFEGDNGEAQPNTYLTGTINP
jgi:hypothetical protein